MDGVDGAQWHACSIRSPLRLLQTHIGSYRANRDRILCQNCVTYPPKPWGNTVI
jgi:hypothetical protein